jgi:hypothetical protein
LPFKCGARSSCGTYGICHAGVCACTAGWSGNRCDTPPDPCLYPAPVSCGYPHGRCQGGSCSCIAGWTGSHCESEMGDLQCAGVSCGGHGTCHAGACACTTGWSGAHCEACANGHSGPTCQLGGCPAGATAGAKYCSDLVGACGGPGYPREILVGKYKHNVTRSACQAACDAAPACTGYSYDNVSGALMEYLFDFVYNVSACSVYGPGLDTDLAFGWTPLTGGTTTIIGGTYTNILQVDANGHPSTICAAVVGRN